MTQHLRNIDDLIHGIPEAKPIDNEQKKESYRQQTDQNEVDDVKNDQKTAVKEEIQDPKIDLERKVDPKQEKKDPELQEIDENDDEKLEKPEKATKLDEYGNEITPSRTYTEEEVNEMMRKRFNRGAFKEMQEKIQQEPAAPVQNPNAAPNATDGFEFDEQSGVPLNVQLNNYIKQTVGNVLTEMQQQEAAKNYQNRESRLQADFESKLETGMTRYPDFKQTLQDKPITDAMILGIRSIDNPAAFLYTASKKHADELRRIAQLPDPWAQATEMGRLHERMTKPKQVSNAPRPMRQDPSDIHDKRPAKVSIEHLIEQDAVSRRRR